ncbi:MAG: hypothetical protein R2861_10795 [Desulfobacterales bacterium]
MTAVADHVSSFRYSHYDGMSTEADDYLPKPAQRMIFRIPLKAF